MSERHALPSGAWIELRDWRELRRGDKQDVMAGISDPEQLMSMMFQVTNGLLALLITNWSYEYPIPAKAPESLRLLPLSDDDALTALVQPAIRALFPGKADPADEGQRKDEASPTEPSAE
jgi:hypothetical protein